MSIDVMKQVLAVMDTVEPSVEASAPRYYAAREALRAAIEQAEKPWVKTYAGGKPNHTTPEKQTRQWQGLTDEEVHEVVSKKWWDWEDAFDIEGFSRAIEAKLREKNT